MILEAIKYIRLQGKSKEWAIEDKDGNLVHFGNINLIVGRNAVGKSRTLAVIREVANLMSGVHIISETPFSSAKYDLVFTEEETNYKYSFAYENKKIVAEVMSVDGELKLNRSDKLLYSPDSGNLEPFEFDEQRLATAHENIESYPFLSELLEWAGALKNAAFTNQFEKNYYLDDLSRLETEVTDTMKEPLVVLHTFWRGKELFGKRFTDGIMKNMTDMGYPIEAVDIIKNGKGYSLHVKEEELDDMTSQMEMSQGMFRMLSFIIMLNYALLSKISVCVLADDLGEGLDFERSKLLIDLMVKNLNKSDIQVFITTNDRYIMNKLPLRYWSVLKRYPKKTVFYNYFNSKDTFEEFKYTGLSNFDFLATDFYINGFEEEEG